MKRLTWLLFALTCLLLLFGVILGTVTQPKGQAITYPQKVRE
jgi:hypothetical protein